MKYKIVADSSSNVWQVEGMDYASVPLKIINGEKEYVDIDGLDIEAMVCDIENSSLPSGTSCPNVYEWEAAYGDADAVFALCISGSLSGSYQAAVQAREQTLQADPDRKVHVINTLSTGPEMHLIIDKLKEFILAGLPFEEITQKVEEYRKKLHLFFCLESLDNLAKNGRISPAVAKIAGILGIRVLGKASDEGTLQQLHKCRGEKKTLEKIVDELKNHNYQGGRLIISHCLNETLANTLANIIRKLHPHCDILIEKCGALCSFYAERGGLIIGFEG